MKRIASLLFAVLFLLSAHVADALSATVTKTRTPTPTPEFVCVPPLCGPGQVAHCPDSCPGGCGLVCATPTPNCLPPADQIRFEFDSQPGDTHFVGQMVRITVTATNTSNLPAGLPQLTLQGASALFDRDPPPVGSSGPLGVFQANFDLVAVRPGIAQLTAFLTYETQIGCPPNQFFGFWQATSHPAVFVVSDRQPGGSPTPTPTPFPACTPIFCPQGQVLHCPGVCPGGCGMVCATPTPTPACSPVSCGPGEVPFCRDPNTCLCPQGCATVTPTPIVPPVSACPGDCNNDRRVDVGDLIQGVRAALGLAGGCGGVFDTNADGSVTVDELIAAVNNALFGCPGPLVLRGTYDAEFFFGTEPNGLDSPAAFRGLGVVPSGQGDDLALTLHFGVADTAQLEGRIEADGSVALFGYRNETDVSHQVHGRAVVSTALPDFTIDGELEHDFGNPFRIQFRLQRRGEVPSLYSGAITFAFSHRFPDGCTACFSTALIPLEIPPSGEGTNRAAEDRVGQDRLGQIEAGTALVSPGGFLVLAAPYITDILPMPQSQIRIFGQLERLPVGETNGDFEIGYHPVIADFGRWWLTDQNPDR